MNSEEFVIYPNPVTNESIIKVNLDIDKNGFIKLNDITGRIIKKYELNAGMNNIFIKNTDFEEGIYQVVLFINGEPKKNCKMIINK